MGKKEKKVRALHEEFRAMLNLVPRLEELLNIHNEIANEYLKYRKNGGDAIPGIEKHVGGKELEKNTSCTTEEAGPTQETTKPTKVKASRKSTKVKDNKNYVDQHDDAEAVT